ncbi:SigE family RNA polymerase sigma factor [Acrocarpospora catenulata]|uniref:SigE family RNA polymerase sigma factor n=1 Tax=Acrocarpospora catenulata TaxID=2836182 RepID=UPI001BD9BEC5|nr:SigE family RNA polymerase sigma factor [Acrocarpospora catenulata]
MPNRPDGVEEDDDYARFARDRADALLRFGYVLTGNPHDAADLTQEALVRLRAAWPRVRRKSDPEAYARTTMARLHVNAWRLRRREQLTWNPPDRPVFDSPEDGDLWASLATLPKKQRTVLVLRYYEDLSDAAIADIMGISRGTVRSQAARGLDKLRTLQPSGSPR